jgi:hypothetical protein
MVSKVRAIALTPRLTPDLRTTVMVSKVRAMELTPRLPPDLRTAVMVSKLRAMELAPRLQRRRAAPRCARFRKRKQVHSTLDQ